MLFARGNITSTRLFFFLIMVTILFLLCAWAKRKFGENCGVFFIDRTTTLRGSLYLKVFCRFLNQMFRLEYKITREYLQRRIAQSRSYLCRFL